jgi:hypothetical protein
LKLRNLVDGNALSVAGVDFEGSGSEAKGSALAVEGDAALENGDGEVRLGSGSGAELEHQGVFAEN